MFSQESCFDNVFHKKSYIGDNLVYCEQCGKKTEATRECEMLEFPRILVLLLKRFDFDNNTMSHFKSDRMVVMPHTLQRQNKMYTLCGIVNHMGSLKGGHYTATILSKEDNTWCEFNDSHVRKLEEQPFADSQTYNSSTAYLLVYRGSEGFRDEVELKRKYGKNDIHHDKEQRSHKYKQECQGQETKKRMKQACSHETGKEVGNKRVNVSSLNEDSMNKTEEDPLLLRILKTSPSRKPHQDNRREAEEGKQQSKTQEGFTSLTNILKNPLCIALIVCGCLLIVILVVIILWTLNLF
ncbi:uncharacterized protein [Labrus bergylta]|uniref:uncharacterized protein n=1 Tax=Labrus bergylta TaxID=56723 RepID=UPI003313A8E3